MVSLNFSMHFQHLALVTVSNSMLDEIFPTYDPAAGTQHLGYYNNTAFFSVGNDEIKVLCKNTLSSVFQSI